MRQRALRVAATDVGELRAPGALTVLTVLAVFIAGVAGCAADPTGDRPGAGVATDASALAPGAALQPADRHPTPTVAAATSTAGSATATEPIPAAAGPGDATPADAVSTAAATSVRRPTITGDQVTAVGDSILVATAPTLDEVLPGIDIDAEVGRMVDEGLDVVRRQAEQGLLRDVVVVELGTNSPFSADQFDQLLDLVDGRPFVLVTNYCDWCGWTDSNNDMIRVECTAAVRCTVADWARLGDGHPEYFADDGIHIEAGGPAARALADLITAALP